MKYLIESCKAYAVRVRCKDCRPGQHDFLCGNYFFGTPLPCQEGSPVALFRTRAEARAACKPEGRRAKVVSVKVTVKEVKP